MKKVKMHFERFRFSSDGKMDGHEKVNVDVPFIDDIEVQENRAYAELFKKYPKWGKGLPLKNGIGWSSALRCQMKGER